MSAWGCCRWNSPGSVALPSLGLDGSETLDVPDLAAQAAPEAVLRATLRRADGQEEVLALRCRLDSAYDARVWRAGGILPFMLQNLINVRTAA